MSNISLSSFITKVNTKNAVDLACIANDCRDDGGTMNKNTVVRENKVVFERIDIQLSHIVVISF